MGEVVLHVFETGQFVDRKRSSIAMMDVITVIAQRVTELARSRRYDDRGAVESAQIFAWIAVTVVAIMGIAAAMTALNADVVCWVRGQVGVGGGC